VWESVFVESVTAGPGAPSVDEKFVAAMLIDTFFDTETFASYQTAKYLVFVVPMFVKGTLETVSGASPYVSLELALYFRKNCGS